MRTFRIGKHARLRLCLASDTSYTRRRAAAFSGGEPSRSSAARACWGSAVRSKSLSRPLPQHAQHRGGYRERSVVPASGVHSAPLLLHRCATLCPVDVDSELRGTGAPAGVLTSLPFGAMSVAGVRTMRQAILAREAGADALLVQKELVSSFLAQQPSAAVDPLFRSGSSATIAALIEELRNATSGNE